MKAYDEKYVMKIWKNKIIMKMVVMKENNK
jgi:hypothetical protein